MMQLYKEYSQKGVRYCVSETYRKNGFFGIIIKSNVGFYRGLAALLTFSVPKTAVRLPIMNIIDLDLMNG